MHIDDKETALGVLLHLWRHLSGWRSGSGWMQQLRETRAFSMIKQEVESNDRALLTVPVGLIDQEKEEKTQKIIIVFRYVSFKFVSLHHQKWVFTYYTKTLNRHHYGLRNWKRLYRLRHLLARVSCRGNLWRRHLSNRRRCLHRVRHVRKCLSQWGYQPSLKGSVTT